MKTPHRPAPDPGVVEKLEALARAIGWPNAAALLNPAGANGCVEEIVEDGHRAHILVDERGMFRVTVARCGRENEGPVRGRFEIDDLEVARAAAQELLAVLAVPQLDLFRDLDTQTNLFPGTAT